MPWNATGGSIRGPAGPQGPTGPAGQAGADGGTTPHASRHATGGSDPLPLVLNLPIAIAYAASLTPDASAGNYRVCTATGNPTLNEPTTPADGQMWRLRVIASGGARTVTFAAGLRRPSHIGPTLPINSGGRGDIGLLYETGFGWTVLAAQAV